LIDGDAGESPSIESTSGFVHLPQKLARIGGKRLNVAALTFSENGIKSNELLPEPECRSDHQFIPGNFDINIFLIMFTRTVNTQIFLTHFFVCLRAILYHLFYI
jgi:hypothetical protein